MLFIPGAYSAKWSLPKYDCPAPAATINESYGVTVSWSSSRWVTVLSARSMCVTSPSTTRAFFWEASTSRVEGAMDPGLRIPVATW